MSSPPCCRPTVTNLLACLEAAERNILPHPGLGEAALPRELISTRRNNSKDTASSISLKLGHWTLLRKFPECNGPLLCKTHPHMAGEDVVNVLATEPTSITRPR